MYERDVRLLTSDGVELATREWLVEGQAQGVVVLVHGFAASKDDRNVVRLAERLRERNLDVLSYDARGHGASGGTCTLGDLEARDVAAAVVLARRRGTPIVLVGASMGGVAVLRHAAVRPDVAGVVVVSTPAEWRVPLRPRAVVTAGLTLTRAGRWVSARRLRVRIHPVWSAPEPPSALVSRVTLPLVVVHGYRDRMIPHRAALDPGRTIESSARLVLVPGMGHAFDPIGHAAICDGVEWVLANRVDPDP
jgi:alpha-beta hydrolase superfamily lysophospholipase